MSLLVWLPLQGDLRNNGLAGDLTFGAVTASYDNAGKIGKALSVRDANIRFIVPELENLKTFSVAFWYKPIANESLTTNWCDILAFTCKQADGSTSGNWRFESSYGNTYQVSHHNNVGDAISTHSSLVSGWGEWHHICVVVNESTEKSVAYVDATVKNTVAHRGGYLTGTVTIAGEGTDPYGLMNDLRIYDHALSDREIKELAKGLVAHWKLDDLIGNENLIRNSNAAEFNGTWVSGTIHHWSRWNQATDNSIELINGKYWFHCKSPASTSYGGFAQDHTLNGDVYRIKPNTQYTVSATWFASAECNCCYWFHWRSSEGGAYNLSQTAKNFTVTTSPQRISATVTSYNHADYTVDRFNLMIGPRATTEGVDIYFTDVKFEEGDTATQWLPSKYDDIYAGWEFNTAHDSSGYCHDGTLSTNPPVFDKDSARYSGCMKFASNYIHCGQSNLYPTDEISVCWWGYMDSWSSYGRAISCTESGGWNFEPSSGMIRFVVYKSAYGYGHAISETSLSSLSSGWHFFAGTFDGYVMKIYVDGEYESVSTDASPEIKAAILYRANIPVYIGCEANGANPSSPYFNGKLSDIRIYATALSADDIKELYAASASIDDRHNVYARELVEE